MPILNYTTKIDYYKTISEIQKCLASKGVSKMLIDNSLQGYPISLTFHLQVNGQLVAFSLPCNFAGVQESMIANRKVPRNLCNEEQALRVGWRIIKDWVEAQMAIVESQLATMMEVFLPYAITKTGVTLYKHIQDNPNSMLLKP